MTLGSKPLTNKPGQFYARCKLTVGKPEKNLTPEERQEAKEKGYERRHRRDLDRPRWDVQFPTCDGFETTDREAYLEHMATVHGLTPSNIRSKLGGPKPYAVGTWRGPRLTEQGLPFKSRDGVSEQCPRCELISERPHDHASELWWSEHLERCVGEASTSSGASVKRRWRRDAPQAR